MASVDVSHEFPNVAIPDVGKSARERVAASGFTLGDTFVATAMGIVAMAIAVGLAGRFGLTPPIAAGCAAFCYFAMLAGHVALRRSERGRSERGRSERARSPRSRPVEEFEFADAEVGPSVPTISIPAKPGSTKSVSPKSVSLKSVSLKSGPVPEKTTGKAIEGIPALDGGLPETGAKAVRASGGKKLTAGDADVGAATLDRRDAQAEISDVKQLDLGNFRPRSPADLSLAAADPSRRGKAAPAEPEASIDDMIKRLAHDIESGRKSNETKSSSGRSEDGAPPPLPGPSERANSTKSPGLAAVSPDDVAAAIGLEPVAAVPDERSASENSRTGGDLGGVDLIGKEMPSPKSAATSKLAAIADALSDEQLEVYLETINGLEDYRAQHYEVSVRLSLADGRKLENAAYIDETRGTGLLPLLEAVKVSSTKRLAIQMIRRGRSGEFFSTVDGEALSDQQFGEDVETITGGDQALASRLVLAFSQADIRNLTAAERRTLESIAALGFRFSVQDITDLDMDFEALAAQGFTFAKLDADVFLKGLPIGPGKVSSADICSHLDGAGLAVIVDKIADEKARAKILGFGAVLGQGAVFGAPRPVRADVLRPTEPPTATL